MRPTLWLEVKRVFVAALDLPRAEREAFVLAACPDPQTLEKVQGMLRRREQVQTQFLQAPVAPHNPPQPGLSESVGPDGRRYTRSDTAESPAPEGPPQLAPGAVIVGRYQLGERLGAGAFGAVHRAKDTLTDQDVAVKVLQLVGDADKKAMRREIAILRMARLPGLVELLDDGVEHGQAFLVMRLVDGKHFPGDVPLTPPDGPVRWADLAPRAIALVEALGRLHWLGVLHRDLKPDNVLVDAAGAVTIVDFGVARDLEGFGDSVAGYLVGTPAYLAPERLGGAPATVASDLYSVGTMLYEFLSGRTPRDGDHIDALIRHRDQPAPPLATVAPDVPPHVAETVDALLHPDPAKRPRSSRLVAALLRGEGEQGARIKLPFVGSDAAVVAVIDAVKSKKPLDLAGAAGCGRTRTLEEADKRLTAEGYRVLWCRPGTKPFESLVPVVGEMPDDPDLTLDDIRKWLRRCLHFWLDVHVCIVADDWPRIDPQSREVLAAVRSSGPLVRVFEGGPGAAASAGGVPPDALVPAPRTEIELRDLFHGPDRIFHLREDAAQELWRRTGGLPGDCVRECEAWVESGIAAWEGGRCRTCRAGIEKLEARIAVTLPLAEPRASQLPVSVRDVAVALEIAACPVASHTVAAVLGAPAWRVDAALGTLSEHGVTHCSGNGLWEAVRSVDASMEEWPPDRRARAHARLAEALPRASQHRLLHLRRAGIAARPEEVAESAERMMDAGRHDGATTLLREAVRASTPGDHANDVTRILVLLVDCAMRSGLPVSLRLTLSDLGRVPPSVDAGRLETVARAALCALEGDWRRSLELCAADSDGPTEVARLRRQVRNFAARLSPDPTDLRREVLALADAVRRSRSVVERARFAECLGWLRYRTSNFRAAIHLHRRSASLRRDPAGRVSALLNAASAAMESQLPAKSARLATEACRDAAAERMVLHEARATWIERATRYRSGEALPPDQAIIDAIDAGLPHGLSAMLALNEAACAWRLGDMRMAARLAATAHRRAQHGGLASVAVLSAGLAAASGDRGLVASATREAQGTSLPPEVCLQAIALWSHGTAGPSEADRRAVELHVRRGALSRSTPRMEILSLAEAFEILGRS